MKTFPSDLSKSILIENIDSLSSLIRFIRDDPDFIQSIIDICDDILVAHRNNSNILICGNGGSASDTQHFVAELCCRFEKERTGLPAFSLTADSSVLTAIANDYSFTNIFSRQVQALGRPNDLLICFSTSGSSQNVLNAVEEAKKLRLRVVCLTGLSPSPVLVEHSHIVLRVPSKSTARIQEIHGLAIHLICKLIDVSLAVKS